MGRILTEENRTFWWEDDPGEKHWRTKASELLRADKFFKPANWYNALQRKELCLSPIRIGNIPFIEDGDYCASDEVIHEVRKVMRESLAQTGLMSAKPRFHE